MSAWCLCDRLCDEYGNVFFFKQKTAYEMRISDWSSDVCSSDLIECADRALELGPLGRRGADLLAVDLGAAGRVELGELLRQIQIGRASCRERVCRYV